LERGRTTNEWLESFNKYYTTFGRDVLFNLDLDDSSFLFFVRLRSEEEDGNITNHSNDEEREEIKQSGKREKTRAIVATVEFTLLHVLVVVSILKI
tara:strand:- start:223 stop:510 length:288 start_codon:yes stop_codon:yes gene_type:complete